MKMTTISSGLMRASGVQLLRDVTNSPRKSKLGISILRNNSQMSKKLSKTKILLVLIQSGSLVL